MNFAAESGTSAPCRSNPGQQGSGCGRRLWVAQPEPADQPRVTNSPVPEVIHSAGRLPAVPQLQRRFCGSEAWGVVRPNSDRRAEYRPSPTVSNPQSCSRDGTWDGQNSVGASQTPGSPASRTRAERFRFRLLAASGVLRRVPRAALATLWVARADANGRPSKINAGNCTRPAPPPANADERWQPPVTVRTISVGIVHPCVRKAIGTEKVTISWGHRKNRDAGLPGRCALPGLHHEMVASSMLHIGASPWRRSSL